MKPSYWLEMLVDAEIVPAPRLGDLIGRGQRNRRHDCRVNQNAAEPTSENKKILDFGF
jgi:hypothetical protein